MDEKTGLKILNVLLVAFALFCAVMVEVHADLEVIDDSNVKLSAQSVITGSGLVPMNLTIKSFSGQIDVAFGFNTQNTNPVYIEVYKGNYTQNVSWNGSTYLNVIENWSRIQPSNIINQTYDSKDKWFIFTGLNINANQTYKARGYLDVEENGKYDIAIKRTADSLSTAISSGRFYFLDPIYNTTITSGGTIINDHNGHLPTSTSGSITYCNGMVFKVNQSYQLMNINISSTGNDPTRYYLVKYRPAWTLSKLCNESFNQQNLTANGTFSGNNIDVSGLNIILQNFTDYMIVFDKAGASYPYKYLNPTTYPVGGTSQNVTWVTSIEGSLGNTSVYSIIMEGISYRTVTTATTFFDLMSPLNNSQYNNTHTVQYIFSCYDSFANTTLNLTRDGINVFSNSTYVNHTQLNFQENGVSFGSHSWNITCNGAVSPTFTFAFNDTTSAPQTTAEAITSFADTFFFFLLSFLGAIIYFASLIFQSFERQGSIILKMFAVLFVASTLIFAIRLHNQAMLVISAFSTILLFLLFMIDLLVIASDMLIKKR